MRRAGAHCLTATLLGALAGAAVAAAPGGTYDCLIAANQIVEIRSPVSGILESVPFGRGKLVHRGEVVATLESSVERSALALAKEKASATGAIDSGLARVDLLGRKFERRRELAAERAISHQERDDADLDQRLASAELKQARETHAQSQLEAQQAADQLARRLLRSPFDGVVVDQYVFPGELVDPSDTRRAIVKLAQFDPLRIDVILPVAAFGSIKVGDHADIEPEKPLQGHYTSTVKLVDRIVDPASGTFGARLELPNPKLQVPPGVKCRVSFRASGR